MSVFNELKRRNVFRVGIAYLIISWLLLQIGDVVFEAQELDASANRALLTILALGFLPALFFAWAFEITPEGVKRERDVNREKSTATITARKLDVVTLFAAVGVLVVFLFDRLVLTNTESVEPMATSPSIVEPVTITDTPPGGSESTPNTNSRSFAAPAATTVDPHSIAVLPFTNRSTDNDSNFFVDGVHDDLLTHLARIGELKVISRTSVLEYRDTNKNLRQIGQELGVATILEGAVQRAGDRVRINAQLIDAATDEHIWAEIFDRELTPSNVFDIQTDIAESITSALTNALVPSLEQTASAPTNNQAAYDLYLESRNLITGISSLETNRRIQLLKDAIALDPQFQLAMTELAYAYIERYWFIDRGSDDCTIALDLLERAEALSREQPYTQLVLGKYYYQCKLDYPRALDALALAEQGLPGNALIYSLRGFVLRRSGRVQEAIAALDKAIQLDPRNPTAISSQTISYAFIGDEQGVKTWADRLDRLLKPDDLLLLTSAVSTFSVSGDDRRLVRLLAQLKGQELGFWQDWRVQLPYLQQDFDVALAALEGLPNPSVTGTSWRPHALFRALIAWGANDREQARTEAELALDVLSEAPENDRRVYESRGLMHAILGQQDAALSAFDSAWNASSEHRNVPGDSGLLASRVVALAFLGDYEDLLAELESFSRRPVKFMSLKTLLLDPAFNDFRDRPEIQALLRQSKGQDTL